MFGRYKNTEISETNYTKTISFGLVAILLTELFGGLLNRLDFFKLFAKFTNDTVNSSYLFKLFHITVFITIQLTIVFAAIIMINHEHIVQAFFPNKKITFNQFNSDSKIDCIKLLLSTVVTVLLCDISFYMRYHFTVTLVTMFICPVILYKLLTIIYNKYDKLINYHTAFSRHIDNDSNFGMLLNKIQQMIYTPKNYAELRM